MSFPLFNNPWYIQYNIGMQFCELRDLAQLIIFSHVQKRMEMSFLRHHLPEKEAWEVTCLWGRGALDMIKGVWRVEGGLSIDDWLIRKENNKCKR